MANMRALVTGGAAGLMRGVAGALAGSGRFERVVITYRTTPPDATLAIIASTAARGAAVFIDFLDDETTIEANLAKAQNEYGPFDVLVHGVGPMAIARFERSTLDQYREMFDGNVRSAVLAARAVLPAMRERGFGRLVFFGMSGSSTTQPTKALALHAAAKSAVVSFARTLALEEAAHGIAVNAIEPHDIRDKYRTREQARQQEAVDPTGRMQTWEDIADAVLLLTDPRPDVANGSVLAITGRSPGSAETG
jgi:3-oxoacyl-[acyl-carrier protein] reductase